MNIKKIILCAVSVIMLAGCSDGISDMIDQSAVIDPSAVDANVLYLYDVKSNAIKVGEELSEDGSGGFWMPISDDVYAEFQDPDWIGAWSPEQYFGANELKEGFKKGVVGFCSRFTWATGEDGKITYMYEENYYEDYYVID